MKTILMSRAGEERTAVGLASPMPLDALVPGDGPWEMELGFGKGRYLLQRALADPERRFLGIEVATKYYRLLARRAARQGATNLLAVRGEALYMLSAWLAPASAEVVHVYFPDPWPKSRHQKRRLFDPETVDLVLGLIRPGGRLCFATDFLEYGALVREILATYPGLELEELGAWPEGPRTNYEAKYVTEGRPILRLVARVSEETAALHPAGESGLLAAVRPPEPPDGAVEGVAP